MSKKSYKDLEAEILLERKENHPELKKVTKATILAKNSRGLFLDINKSFEGYVSTQELGSKCLDDYRVGELIDVFVTSEDKNQGGVFKLSIKKIEDDSKWHELEELKGQNLELTITKVLKSGIEVEIALTKQIGFIPFGYLNMRDEQLKSKKREQWPGTSIPGRIHELEQGRNKIILNNKVISEEHKEAKAQEVISSISIGQTVTGEVVRTTDFGVFVDIGGLDALIPSSELSWKRFKKPSDITKVGDKIEAKIFKIEAEKKRVALSVKQFEPDPWSTLPEEIKVGYKAKTKVVTHADFGAFVEVAPGVEALLHKTNFPDGEAPDIGNEIEIEVINLDPNKKRMGVKILTTTNNTETPTQEEDQKDKEPEYA